MSALVALLCRSADYAGLFPPAALDLESVVDNYAEYRNSSQRWMLGRLVIEASRLEELQQTTAELFSGGHDEWKLSVLLPPPVRDDSTEPSADFADGVEAIRAFNADQSIGARVEAIEVKASTIQAIEILSQQIPGDIEVFVEIPHHSREQIQDAAGNLLAARREFGRTFHGKIRTGSVVADEIPLARQVADFIEICVRQKIAFKATAGLHHPIRAEYPLTYAEDAPTGTMHGFVNLFVASVLATKHGLDASTLEEILLTVDPAAFCFAEETIQWKNLSVSESDIADQRQQGIQSFGTCSFVEPIGDLRSLGLGSALTASAI